ncbi:MAG TPA: sulfotransferase [Verrucomicrobiae bacterium]|nr:sulfotransferase [Verrucomicrobiae bacterium]
MIHHLFSHPYIVIGMHRAGTSMLAGLLHSSGIFMGNDLGKRNEHYESELFQAINLQLLTQHGWSWTSPGVPADFSKIRLSTFQLMCGYIKSYRHPRQLLKLLSGKPWGWKDPRNTFTLPAWLKLFPDARVIHIYRNGMDVALSLWQRNLKLAGTKSPRYEKTLESKMAGLDLWEKYTAQAFACEPLLGERMLTVQFEKIIACDAEEVGKLERFTGASLRQQIQSTADPSRQSRFADGQHENLISYARKSCWMNKLGYL